MKNILFLLLLLFYTNIYALDPNVLRYEGNSCIGVYRIDLLLETARDTGISKVEMLNKIDNSVGVDVVTKAFMREEMKFIYNLAPNTDYSHSILKQCRRTGYVTRTKV